jgi:hypothetical protein
MTKRKANPERNGRRPTITAPAEIGRKQRAAEILSLRLRGMTLEAIGHAQTPPLSRARVCQIIAETLAADIDEPMSQLRTLELRRFDEMLLSVYAEARAGNLAAVDRVLSVIDRRARLQGLNAPASLKAEVRSIEQVSFTDAAAAFKAKVARFVAAAEAQAEERQTDSTRGDDQA